MCPSKNQEAAKPTKKTALEDFSFAYRRSELPSYTFLFPSSVWKHYLR